MLEPKNKTEVYLQAILSALQTLTEEVRELRKERIEPKRDTRTIEPIRKTVMKP